MFEKSLKYPCFSDGHYLQEHVSLKSINLKEIFGILMYIWGFLVFLNSKSSIVNLEMKPLGDMTSYNGVQL